MTELEKKLRVCEDERAAVLKQYETIQQENRQLSDEHCKEMANTTLTIDDLKMKVKTLYSGLSGSIILSVNFINSYTELNWRGTSYNKH